MQTSWIITNIIGVCGSASWRKFDGIQIKNQNSFSAYGNDGKGEFSYYVSLFLDSYPFPFPSYVYVTPTNKRTLESRQKRFDKWIFDKNILTHYTSFLFQALRNISTFPNEEEKNFKVNEKKPNQ